MKNSEFATGNRYELVSVMPGKVKDTPVGVVTFRLKPEMVCISVMLDRPALERLVEDVSFILRTSATLAEGNHQELPLALIEEIGR